MSEILVLTGLPGSSCVTATLAREARDALTSAGAQANEVIVLGEGDAAQIGFSDLDIRSAREKLSGLANGAPVDFSILPSRQRRKKLLVADMDSTIITAECIDELADLAGLKDQIADITQRAMRGELEFEMALRERVAMLKGLETTILAKVYEERIRLTSGARELVSTMKALGAFTALISGGFSYFTARVAGAAGFNFQQANTLLERDGLLTGKVQEPILGSNSKKIGLETFRDQSGINKNMTLAVGDGANDLEMIEEAGLGVAFRAKPILAEAADVHIQHGDLTALLYLQGYRREEFKTD